MKTREDFSRTITFTMDETDKLCSFGYHKFDLIQGPISAILYGIGKLCRYTFGLIIGIFAASFAYGFTALKNWFSYEKSRKINETEATQQQIESSESQISAESNVAAILKKEDLELKVRSLVEKLNSKISALESEYEVTLQEKFSEYEATLQQEAEDHIQEYASSLESMSSSSTTSDEAENIDMKKVEKVVVEKLMPKAVSKMIDLMFSNPPTNKFQLVLTLESLKKDLENLMQQLNAQLTQNELSNISKQYTLVLNKIKLFWHGNPEKQGAKVTELPVKQADRNSIMLTGLVGDKITLFSKTTGEKLSHVDEVTQIQTLSNDSTENSPKFRK